MQKFYFKQLYNTDLRKELNEVGFDKSYIDKAVSKFEYKIFKIYNLNCAQANIIKQTALSVGTDCATNKNVITGNIDFSDCILGGSVSQLQKIAHKLQLQPFKLKELGIMLEKNLSNIKLPKTKIVGILNITTNSFSDGGKYYDFNDSVKHLHKLIEDGADVIDIGAESTKPYSTPVSDKDQLKKLLPILEYIKDNNINTPISIDTRSSIVAQECISAGANIINDVSGFDFDNKIVDVISNNENTKIIIQHSLSTPDVMQNCPTYKDVIKDIFENLKLKIEYAVSSGIDKNNIIIDPGIGFGKTKEHNLQIIKHWQEFKSLELPILIGISRKSFLEMQDCSNEEKDTQTLAVNSVLMSQNIDYIRVHNVKIHKIFQNIYG